MQPDLRALEFLRKRTLRLDYSPRACVYLLMLGDEVVYIGQTRDILMRLWHHRTKEFDHVLVLPVESKNLRKVEKALITFFQPPLCGEYSKKQADEMPGSCARCLSNALHKLVELKILSPDRSERSRQKG